jgi:hypothetical protein
MEIARHRGSRFVGNESSRYHLTAEGGLKPRYGARLSAAQATFPKCQSLRFRLDEGMQETQIKFPGPSTPGRTHGSVKRRDKVEEVA